VFAFDVCGRRLRVEIGEESFVDGTAGSDGAGDDKFDEIAT
jgi:hypothetical protein